MFTDENTEGYSKTALKIMNAELEALMSDVNKDSPEYHEIEKRNSEFILKKYDAEMCELIDFFFTVE